MTYRAAKDSIGRALTSSELRTVQLRALDLLLEWCNREDISCFPIYGTLLGAIRHQGYIPWDDDIDLMMPRKGYQLLRRARWIGDLKVGGYMGDSDYPYMNVKIGDPRTIVTKDGFYEAGLGAGVDVFPIDSIGRGPLRLLQRFLIGSLVKVLSFQTLVSNDRRPKHKNLAVVIVAPISRLIARRWLLQMLDAVARGFPPGLAQGVLVGSYQWSVPSDFLKPAGSLPFEGRTLPSPSRPSEVAKALYGNDFMVPPPLDNRASHHSFVVHWRE